MLSNQTTKREIRYLGKDFNQFRQNLINFVKTYFQNTFNDFDPNDPGIMFIELASSVGDTLSFYLDTQIKETMLLYAEERQNILSLAQSLGYKPRVTSPAITDINVYQVIPAIGSGESNIPDYRYALKLNPGMIVSSISEDIDFITQAEVDFSISTYYNPTSVEVYQTDGNGEPTFYLLKKSVRVESGTQKTTTFNLGDPERYLELDLTDTNVIKIDSILDSDSNEWLEVDYLSQDTVFEQVNNNVYNDAELSVYSSEVPYLLKMKAVPKRFVTRYNDDFSLKLMFGAGISDIADEEMTPNPDNVGITIPTGVTKLNYDWNVANFLYTTSYGEAPHNTTLTVKYTVGGGVNTNVIPNIIRKVKEVAYSNSTTGLDQSLLTLVKQSLSVNNPEAATGGKSEQSVEEIKLNALAYFASQGRTVSKDDYIIRSYSMPQQFGSIAKAYITQDEQISFDELKQKIKNPLALNLYILSYNADKQLVNANTAIKENLKVYLDRYRMITDGINIKNAYVVNFRILYEITVLPDYSAKEVLLYCTDELTSFFDIEKWQINQPIVKADIIRTLANVKGVQSVLNVNFENVFDEDAGYWPNVYDLNVATNNGVIYPSKDPMIFEIKYPENDILGRAKNW